MEYEGNLPEEKAVSSLAMLCPKKDLTNDVDNHNHLRQYCQKLNVTKHTDEEQLHLPSKAKQYDIHIIVIKTNQYFSM